MKEYVGYFENEDYIRVVDAETKQEAETYFRDCVDFEPVLGDFWYCEEN